MCNVYSYMRISTKEDRQKQNYNRQAASLARYAREKNIEYLIEFKEDVSGKDFEHRKQWNVLEQLLQPGSTVVFKDISRFTREAENGYNKYMELLNKGIELIFIDNPTVSTPYIKQLLSIAKKQNLVAKTSLENTVKLLLIVELDRVEQERLTFIKRVKDGIAASEKKSGRKSGTLDKMTPELEEDIREYLVNRSIKQIDILNKYNISRNTLKKYIVILSDNYGKGLNQPLKDDVEREKYRWI